MRSDEGWMDGQITARCHGKLKCLVLEQSSQMKNSWRCAAFSCRDTFSEQ